MAEGVAPCGVIFYFRLHLSARVETLLVERHLDDDHGAQYWQPAGGYYSVFPGKQSLTADPAGAAIAAFRSR